MSPSIYKYLPREYAELMVSGGVLFRSLQFFLACEDARRDVLEGIHQYQPPAGLEITNHTQGWRRVIPGSAMRSRVKHPDKVFVFCSSRVLSSELAAKFKSDACVEITEVHTFAARLRTALRREPRAKLTTLIHREVEYYNPEEPPKEVWALPDRIVFNKPRRFCEEQEFRFAFSLKSDAFKFQNVDLTVATAVVAPLQPGAYPQMLVRLGSMADCSRVHGF